MIYIIKLLLISFIAQYHYPTKPFYLNNLCDNSQLIIKAEVVKNTAKGEGQLMLGTSELKVEQIIKGTCNDDRIKVKYSPIKLYPKGPVYKKGKKVIVFLTKHENGYRAAGLSNATRYFDNPSQYSEFTSRIKKYLEISENGALDSTKVVDWIIENLDYHTTKHDAIRLIGQSIYNRFYQEKGHSKNVAVYNKYAFPIEKIWSDSQKGKVRERILNETIHPRYHSWQLLCSIYDPEDLEFENFLISKLSEYIDGKTYYAAIDIVKTLDISDIKASNMRDDVLKINPIKQNIPLILQKLNRIKEVIIKARG